MRSYPSLGRWLRGEEIELVVLEAVERLDGAASVDIERETRETMLGLGLPAEGAPPIVFSLLRSYAASDPPLVPLARVESGRRTAAPPDGRGPASPRAPAAGGAAGSARAS